MAAIELSEETQHVAMMDPETWPVMPDQEANYADTLHLGLQRQPGKMLRWLQCPDCGLLRNWITDIDWAVQLGAEWTGEEPIAWPDGSPLIAGQCALCLWCGHGENLSVSAVRDQTPPTAIQASGKPVMVYG